MEMKEKQYPDPSTLTTPQILSLMKELAPEQELTDNETNKLYAFFILYKGSKFMRHMADSFMLMFTSASKHNKMRQFIEDFYDLYRKYVS